jgi:hypothetical protein
MVYRLPFWQDGKLPYYTWQGYFFCQLFSSTQSKWFFIWSILICVFPIFYFPENVLNETGCTIYRYTVRTRKQKIAFFSLILTLILLMWRIRWVHNNSSRWHMGFNSTFKGLTRWILSVWSEHALYFVGNKLYFAEWFSLVSSDMRSW